MLRGTHELMLFAIHIKIYSGALNLEGTEVYNIVKASSLVLYVLCPKCYSFKT